MEEKDPIIHADLEISSIDGDRCCYSVKLDGHEVSRCVRRLTLKIEPSRDPTLLLEVNAEKISINSRCIWEIPEPYAGLLEEKKLTSPDIKACEQSVQSGNGSKLD